MLGRLRRPSAMYQGDDSHNPKWVSKPIQIKEHCSILSNKVKESKSVWGFVPFEMSCDSGPQEPGPSSRASPSPLDSGEVTVLGQPTRPTNTNNPAKPKPRNFVSDAKLAFRDLGPTPTNSPNMSDETIKHLGLDTISDIGLGWKVLAEAEPSIRDILALDLEQGSNTEMQKLKSFPENSNYKTVQIRLKHKDERVRSKYGNILFKRTPMFNPCEVADLIPDETVVVVVRVFWPYYLAHTKRNQRDPRFSQEIVILGSQTLERLRDVITCVTDISVPGEISNDPYSLPEETAKDIYKSCFFFINGTFYNDFSHPDNIDYSEVIRKWALEKNIADFDASTMDSVKVEDLTVQLGYPYLFMHQGNCEHLLTFSDVRLLHARESRSSASYPYVVYNSDPKIQSCFTCNRSPARWLTEDNIRVPFTPCYFCEKCFHSFNYVDGKKVGQFKAYYFKGPIVVPVI